ncbi:hypothetical protein [Rhizobium sp. ARZ01]|uniref:hypothetical protein n=1 Tax=Rhizobium sp. ARZ01 TaxID=2769313 RepID=UPI001FEFEB10|nr:hypothetical protein [Rhizobium sp. ARZ01]
MTQTVLTSITRRSLVAGLTAAVASMGAMAGIGNAQANQTASEESLYERLGGVFVIAAVVDHFSDAVVKNPIVGQESKNPQLREWHTKNLGRAQERGYCRLSGARRCRVSASSGLFPDRGRQASARAQAEPERSSLHFFRLLVGVMDVGKRALHIFSGCASTDERNRRDASAGEEGAAVVAHDDGALA